MLHLCPLSYQKPTSSTGAEASGWGEHICLHDGCLAHHLKPQLYCWRWFSRFGRMVVKIDSRSWASCQKLLPASAAPGDFCPPSLSLELSPPSTAPGLCWALGSLLHWQCHHPLQAFSGFGHTAFGTPLACHWVWRMQQSTQLTHWEFQALDSLEEGLLIFFLLWGKGKQAN